ncbi:MAG TPA: SPOR domain-containing protein [Dongiaceae bacterium]|nr:SPOR domain-containing protein [Dongiaceae bacterium]
MMIASSSSRRRRVHRALFAFGCLCGFAFVDCTQPAKADMAAAQAAIAAGNFPAAGAALAPLAAAGDAQAQFQWASLALDGRSVGLPPERAISLLVQAAAQGNSHAQARLGIAYALGDHVASDNLAAYHWLSRASAASDLTDSERARVTSLRQDLLEQIAPTNKYAPDTSSASSGSLASGQAIPAADRAAPAPVRSVASVPLASDTPLPSAADESAVDAGSASGDATPKPASKDRTLKTTQAAAKPVSGTQATSTAVATASPPPSAGANTVPAGSKAYFVQLASLPTPAAATTEAARLAKKYAAILQDIDVSVHQADLGAKGITQRVLAGPFDGPRSAKDRCDQLTAHQQACRVISMLR